MFYKTALIGALAFVLCWVPVVDAGTLVHPSVTPPNPGMTTGTVTSTTAHAFNGTMTVTYDDGTTSAGTIAVSGNETLTYSAGGALLSGQFKFTATINGKTFSGTARARLGSGRYYSDKYKCPETGIAVRFSVLIGHPEGCAGSGTFTEPRSGPHGFGHGTGVFGCLP